MTDLASIAARIEAAGVPYRTRAQWGATAPLGPVMTLPAAESWIHHSVTVADDDHQLLSTGDVDADMREIETVTVGRFGRFAYSWCVHPSGVIGEGAGLTIGAHTADHNSIAFGLCAIGDYSTIEPPSPMLHAFAVLVAVLEAEGALVAGAQPTGGHRDTKATACPGDQLYARLASIRIHADDPALLNPQEDEMPTRMFIRANGAGEVYLVDPEPAGSTGHHIPAGKLATAAYLVGVAGKTLAPPPQGAVVDIIEGHQVWVVEPSDLELFNIAPS